MEFETVIGLEVHAELATNTKAFCSCGVTFGAEPNTFCCPVCMGYPGALPRLNKKVVEYGVKIGLATNCTINEKSLHARKNYFYPDLPKGYQISQGKYPLCANGYVMVSQRKIRINRIHIEEDAGKLIHHGNVTKIDYNRAGVPLVEIVTEPDLRSSNEAKEFLEKIRELLLWLGISNCRMQEGNLRCDVNVSVRRKGDEEYNQRCEMKNINSFSAMVHAIEYEEQRQRKILRDGGKVLRETRRWDEERGESFLLRDKEAEADYRYFTDPDLPVIHLKSEVTEEIRKSLPELPEQVRERYGREYGFMKYEADEVVKEKSFATILDEGVAAGGSPKKLYNWIMGDVARIINEKKTDDKKIPFSGKELAELIALVDKGEISMQQGKAVLSDMFETKKSPDEIVKEKGFTQLTDKESLRDIVKLVLKENEKSVSDYKKGKKNALSFLMGQCMKRSENRGNPQIFISVLTEEINK